jgi:hypothetical protein
VLAANALYKPFYKLSYLAALKNAGLMDRLSGEPVSFESLVAIYAPSAKAGEALKKSQCERKNISIRLRRLGKPHAFALSQTPPRGPSSQEC